MRTLLFGTLGFLSLVPPKQAFADEAACAASVKQMLDITPACVMGKCGAPTSCQGP